MTEISPELVERCVALVRQVAQGRPGSLQQTINRDLARAIAAELPAPVDPDLVLAREVASLAIVGCSPVTAGKIAAGNGDAYSATQIALAAIKRVHAERD
jgi:hypothetical protein